jgi:hypothetical protein
MSRLHIFVVVAEHVSVHVQLPDVIDLSCAYSPRYVAVAYKSGCPKFGNLRHKPYPLHLSPCHTQLSRSQEPEGELTIWFCGLVGFFQRLERKFGLHDGKEGWME